jgi:hypothetical protein
MRLPVDLTAVEADRLAVFVKSLAVDLPRADEHKSVE